jgi:hypothetical protein
MKFVKLFEEFEQSLNEKAGVPKSIIPLAEDLSQKVFDAILKPLKRGYGQAEIEEDFKYRKVLDEDFPITKATVSVTYQVVEDLKNKFKRPEQYDGLVVQGSYHGGKNLKESSKGFEIHIDVELIIGDDFVEEKKYEDKEFMITKIEALFFHELLHAYEDVKRKSSHGRQIADTSMQIYVASSSNMRRGFGIPEPVSQFLFLVYAAAAFEVSARNSEIWPKIRKISDPREREKVIKQTEQWEIANMLEKFDHKKFLEELKEEIDKINKLLSADGEDMIDPDRAIRKMIRDMKRAYIEVSKDLALKSLEKARNSSKISIELDIEKLKERVEKNFDTIRSISEDPQKFFKNWETRFHTMGRIAKRKMSKMTTATEV